MKSYEEMYGKPDPEWFYPSGGYQPILDAIGEIVAQEDQDDYQGDSWVLYRRGDEYGYLKFGWGSCSGCDALQACDSPSEVEELARDMENRVEWKSLDEMETFIASHDWEGDYSGESDECKAFIEKAKQVFAEARSRKANNTRKGRGEK